MTQKQVVQRVLDAIVQAGSQKALAARWGISTQYLNDVIRDRREPGAKVLDALGLQKVVEYVVKEIR